MLPGRKVFELSWAMETPDPEVLTPARSGNSLPTWIKVLRTQPVSACPFLFLPLQNIPERWWPCIGSLALHALASASGTQPRVGAQQRACPP